MKTPSSLILTALVLFVAATAQAQSSASSEPVTRPRLVAGETSKSKYQEPSSKRPAPARTQEAGEKSAEDEPRAAAREESNRRLSPNRLRSRLNEARRLLKARPLPTAMTGYWEIKAFIPPLMICSC